MGFEMKKVGVSLIIFGLMVLVMAGVASASVGESIREGLDSFSENISPVLSWILGDVGSADLLFVKLLVTIVIISVALFALKKFPNIGESKGLAWIIAVIVGLLGARFLTTDALIQFVWTPYGVLGILFATLLPFVIFFYFVESFNSSIIRKVSWISFGVIYIIMAITRWDELAFSSPKIIEFNGWLGLQVGSTSAWWQNFGWIYVLIAIFSIFAILSDRWLRTKYFAAALTRDLGKDARRRAQSILVDINRLNSKLEHAQNDDQRNAIKQDIASKRKALSSLSEGVGIA